jgi:hypothetical protein
LTVVKTVYGRDQNHVVKTVYDQLPLIRTAVKNGSENGGQNTGLWTASHGEEWRERGEQTRENSGLVVKERARVRAREREGERERERKEDESTNGSESESESERPEVWRRIGPR